MKINFIADRHPRVGLPLARGALVVDTVRNILSNKICAVPFAKPDTVERYAAVLPDLIRDLRRGGMNSLAEARAPELS